VNSKSFVEKAERIHLVDAAADIGKGVSKIQKVIEIEKEESSDFNQQVLILKSWENTKKIKQIIIM
jgi:hypothetical protein